MSYWRILYDNDCNLCFVGNTVLNKQFITFFNDAGRQCEIITLEELQSKDPQWIKERQFITVTGDVVLKKQIAAELADKNAHLFSIVGLQNLFNNNVKIGRGTFINNFNDLLCDGVEIGDHCIVSCYCQFGRNVKIENFAHISSYCYLNDCIIGEGAACGARTSIVGVSSSLVPPKVIPPYTNLMVNSTINKSIKEPGTYFGNRKINEFTRLEYRIV